MRAWKWAIAGLVVSGSLSAQQPIMISGQGGFGGPGGGRGMMGGNPDDFFNMIARGKDVIRRDDVDPMFQRMFDRMAERMGITNGQITREQFRQASEQMQQRMREGGFGGPGGGDAGDRFMESRFRQYDKNGDGLLGADEMPDALKGERDKWDKNKDGFIDLAEFKEYAKERFGANRPPEAPAPGTPETPAPAAGTDPNNGMPTPELPPDVVRPIVYRTGFLPKELPSWFTEMDLDKDAQVSLNEWCKGAKTMSEFTAVAAEERFAAIVGKFRGMDGNDDGFVTAEEVLRYLKQPVGVAPPVVASRGEPSYRMNRDRSAGNDRGGNGNGDRGERGGRNFGPRGGGGPGAGNGSPTGNGGGDFRGMGPRGSNGNGESPRGMGPRGGNGNGNGGPPNGGERRRGFEKGKGAEKGKDAR